MGLISASCGGNLRMIETKPFVKNKRHHYLSEQPNWLTNEAIKAMEQYFQSSQWLLTHNAKQRQLLSIKAHIKSMIETWLALETNNIQLAPATLAERLNLQLSTSINARKFAYDPKLTRLFIHTIDSITECGIPENTPNLKNNENYLLIPELKISASSAMNSSVSSGMFSMMSLYGFIHAFERNMWSILSDFCIESFAVCIHHYHIEKRGLTREAVRKGKQNIAPPAMYDDWQSDFSMSLLIKTSTTKILPVESIMPLIPKRFARGTVHVRINGINHIGSFSEPLPAIQAIKNPMGNWLTFNSSLILPTTDSLINAVLNQRKLWLTIMGYQYLESPKEKPGSLRGYPHAFAENILGFVQPTTVTHATNLDDLFWRYQLKPFGICLLPRSLQ
jgi:CRISPR-associated protein Csy2